MVGRHGNHWHSYEYNEDHLKTLDEAVLDCLDGVNTEDLETQQNDAVVELLEAKVLESALL